MRFCLRAAALVALVLIACSDPPSGQEAATSTTTAASATPRAAAECGRPHPAGQSTESFDFEGQTRTYQLYVPASYDGSQPVPLVFNFHGYGSNAVQQMFYGDFKPLAEERGFLLVAPDGQGDRRHFVLFNEEPGLQDDVAMVGALLDRLETDLCVDAARVYSTGMSDGGAITSVLACRAADRFAAFAAVAAVIQPVGCDGGRPVPFAAFMGTDDPVVPFDGGTVSCCGNPTIGSAPDALASWGEHDGCDPAFREERLDTEIRRRTWSGCEGTSEVVFYIVDGGGHTWPGSIAFDALGHTTAQLDASATIWAFFEAHALDA